MLALIVFVAEAFAYEPVGYDGLELEIRGGNNASFGDFAAVSLLTQQCLGQKYKLAAGVQYNTIDKISLETRTAYLKEYNWGILSTEAILAYTDIKSVGSISAGAGLGLSGKRIEGKLGYYYRWFGGNGNSIHEPFNIFYEFSVKFLTMNQCWDLQFDITNCEIFELERHYQPSLIAECRHYPSPDLGIIFGLGYKPSGMFNMSSDYYQTFLNLGLCYRW